MWLTSPAAERLQRALEAAAPGEIGGLAETARAVTALRSSVGTPSPGFAEGLRARLLDEVASSWAAGPPARTPAPQPFRRSRPAIAFVGRGLPRLAAGALASALAVATVVGVAAQGSLPGGALYPVKGWLDAVAVQLAGSDYERGLTRLAQAEEHIADARALSLRGEAVPEDVIAAITSATASVRDGQDDLAASFEKTGNPQAIVALRDFSARARPQVDALRPDVPAAALPALHELSAVLGEAEAANSRLLAGWPSLSPVATSSLPAGHPAAEQEDPADQPQAPRVSTSTPPASPGGGDAVPPSQVDVDGGGAVPTITATVDSGTVLPEATAPDDSVDTGTVLPKVTATVDTGTLLPEDDTVTVAPGLTAPAAVPSPNASIVLP
jgi:hypothetical protein